MTELRQFQFGGRPVDYPPAPGFKTLRCAIAAYLQRQNSLSVDPSRIIVTIGATQAILVALGTLKLAARLQGGALQVHFLTPTWNVLPRNQARMLDVTCDDVPSTLTDGVWTIPALPDFHRAGGADVHVVFGANPGNPTGRLTSLDSLRSPESFCLLDITYESMLYEGEGHLDLAPLAVHAPSTFVVGSLSKTFAIPGVRVGYLVSPPSFASDCADVLNSFTMGVSVLDQAYALSALESWQASSSWFRAVRDELRTRANVVFTTLRDLGFALARPNAAYYAFGQLPDYVEGSAAEFSQRLLARGVRLVPGDDFGGAPFRRFIRVSFGNEISLAALRLALHEIGEECNSQQQPTAW
jgi:aspartate/methionine/tyrosine aminotransferase